MPEIIFLFLTFLFGLIFGSFANVCIYRLPKAKSFMWNRSFCPKCKKLINWYDNIPLISYMVLNAKCRKCKKNIPKQYFLIELISGLSFLFIYMTNYSLLAQTFLAFLVLAYLIIFFIDLKHHIIPDILNFGLIFFAFVKNFFPDLNLNFTQSLEASIVGGLVGYFSIWSIIQLYYILRKREGMGLGDAKLLAVIGFWFGWIAIPFVIFSSSIIALLHVIPSLINKSKKLSSEIPFGPYIIAGCILYIIFIDEYKMMLFR